MSSTFTQVGTRALGDDMSVTRLPEAIVHVREAVLQIYRETRIRRGDIPLTLVNIGAGATTLTLNGTGVYTDALIMADNGDQVLPMELSDLIQLRQQNPNLTGRPLAFAPLGDPTSDAQRYELWPKTNAAYQVFALGAQEPLTTDLEDADPVPLPDVWLKLPMWYARGELFAFDSDTEMATYWNGRWENGCASLRSDLQRKIGGNRQVPGTWSNVAGASPTFHYKGLF